MKHRVVLTAAARDDVHLIDNWWRANRQSALGLFAEELMAALALLEVAPEMGRPYRYRVVPGLRRVLLRSTRHHVYYVVRASSRDLERFARSTATPGGTTMTPASVPRTA